MFPLELFLLPGELSHLHIFEPRYRQLLADCAAKATGFGIPFTEKGKWAGIGTYVKILPGYTPNDDGTTDIQIEAEQLFMIQKIFLSTQGRQYPSGEVKLIPTMQDSVSEKLVTAMSGFLKDQNQGIAPELLATDATVYDLARLIPLNFKDKIKLVKAPDPVKKETILLNRIKLFEKIRNQTRSFKGEFFLN